MSVRDILVRIHRYAGLTMAAFLIIAGVTGSVLAFQYEIDAWLNPALFTAKDRGPLLPPSELTARVEGQDARLRVIAVPLKIEPGWSARLQVQARVDAATGRPYPLGFDQLFVEPATGAIIGRRLARASLIPLVHLLHFTLLDPTGYGTKILGWIALVWTIDCFVGFYLTWPRGRPFLQKWRPAWTLKRDASAYRLNLDLHRASGLWLWGILFVVALSSVYFNLYREVFKPAVNLLSPLTPSIFDERRPDRTRLAKDAAISFDGAVDLANTEARRRGWSIEPGIVVHHASYGLFGVRFWPSQNDRGSGLGRPILYFDDRDGRLMSAWVPGEGTAGDVTMHLQFPLHSGRIAGLPGRIVVCIAGVAVALLSVTGIVIWWRKYRSRSESRRRGSMIVSRAE